MPRRPRVVKHTRSALASAARHGRILGVSLLSWRREAALGLLRGTNPMG